MNSVQNFSTKLFTLSHRCLYLHVDEIDMLGDKTIMGSWYVWFCNTEFCTCDMIKVKRLKSGDQLK